METKSPIEVAHNEILKERALDLANKMLEQFPKQADSFTLLQLEAIALMIVVHAFETQ